jgi:predicted Fe-Mo cluster-binding NifX family protein
MTDANGTTLRVAIPSESPGGLTARRSGHFGRCECFTMVDIVDGRVGDVEVLTNAPHTEGGCMAPVLVLAEHNVDAIVVDGIGGRPLMGFNQVGIAVHAGVGEDVQTTVHAFIQGGLPVVGFEGACQH